MTHARSKSIGAVAGLSLGLLLAAPVSAHPFGLAGALASTVVGLATLPLQIAAAAATSVEAPAAYVPPTYAVPYRYAPGSYYAPSYYRAPSYYGLYAYRPAVPRYYSPAPGYHGYRASVPRYNSWSGYRPGSHGGYYHYPH